MNRVSSVPLKPFLDYSKNAIPSEDTIFNLHIADAHERLQHLQIVDVPHKDVKLSQCWNYLDIPLSSEIDVNLS